MPFPYEEFDLSTMSTYPLKSRPSKVNVSNFGRPHTKGAGVAAFVDALPDVLAGADFRAVVRAIAHARSRGGVVWGLGAHVIKTGLSRIIIDLMERGFVSAIATNGAGLIHDFEIALVGSTSENVDESLGPGRFGMAEETDGSSTKRSRAGSPTDSGSARPQDGGSRVNIRSTSGGAWRQPRHGSAFPSPSTSPSGPTSHICTLQPQAPRLAREAFGIFDTSSRTWPASNAACI